MKALIFILLIVSGASNADASFSTHSQFDFQGVALNGDRVSGKGRFVLRDLGSVVQVHEVLDELTIEGVAAQEIKQQMPNKTSLRMELPDEHSRKGTYLVQCEESSESCTIVYQTDTKHSVGLGGSRLVKAYRNQELANLNDERINETLMEVSNSLFADLRSGTYSSLVTAKDAGLVLVGFQKNLKSILLQTSICVANEAPRFCKIMFEKN